LRLLAGPRAGGDFFAGDFFLLIEGNKLTAISVSLAVEV
jgi:hypothetical protein